MNQAQQKRIYKLRRELDKCGKPLGDLDTLRWMFDELLAILTNELGETNIEDLKKMVVEYHTQEEGE